MNWWDRLWGRKASALETLPDFLMVTPTKSGQSVTFSTALQVSTVLACCRVLAEGVSQVPLKVFKPRDEGGADPATDHPLYFLLYRKPNGWQTSFEFRETMMLHLVLCGNFYAYKNYVGGRLYELLPLEPGKVTVNREADYSLSYTLTSDNGERRNLPASEIWHVRGPSWNSWMGMEAVKLAREAVGLSMALEEAHARLHENGVQPSGIYSIDGILSPEGHKSITAWIKAHASGKMRGDPLILDRAAKWVSQVMTGVDAQHIETRKFQVEEVCRALRVMPIMVGASDKTATYASSEQMFLAHVVHHLAPWCERIEQSIDVNLFTEADQRVGLYAKFNLNGLLRGAVKDRAAFYTMMWNVGAISPDEIRAYEELNPIPNGLGANYFAPLNTAPLPTVIAGDPTAGA